MAQLSNFKVEMLFKNKYFGVEQSNFTTAGFEPVTFRLTFQRSTN